MLFKTFSSSRKEMASALIALWLFLVGFTGKGGTYVHSQSQQNPPGFISIDCGALKGYNHRDLKIDYVTDDGFVDFGHNEEVSTSEFSVDTQLTTLRVFPNGTRNCYTIQLNSGVNKYLIRASFLYGNYDHQNKPPTFDLYIGVNYWATVDTASAKSPGSPIHKEIIHVVPSMDHAIIQVCLVNTAKGTPFISSLEVRQLDVSMYQNDNTTLSLYTRLNIGSNSSNPFRHPYDAYDRLWYPDDTSYDDNTESLSWPSADDPALDRKNDSYQVPWNVLKTYTTPKISKEYTDWSPYKWNTSGATYKFILYFHFAELDDGIVYYLKRIISIDVNAKPLNSSYLMYLTPVTLPSMQVITSTGFNVKFNVGYETLSPILNAMEAYYLLDMSNAPTALNDVNAMNDIKTKYNVAKYSWQGDPCIPTNFTWEGLNCSTEKSPRITSLNLSSSGLKGSIQASFASLRALETLDLSYNQLTGPVPEFLADLEHLTILNLSGNKFTGSIPERLLKKFDDPGMLLSVDGTLNLKRERKRDSFVVPIVAAASGLLGLLLIVIAIIWKVKSKEGKGPTEGAIISKNRPFTYNEVLEITEYFKTVIGEGGFGKVYLGTLADGTKVAVKMLSRTSRQGSKEFQAEAQLLMIVHHRNLVSLVGYCDHAENMALIYEFMENGDLRHYLSEEWSMTASVLTWNERLQIAIDAAQGLDYLHNGCKPPIIHRDLKTANILLNDSMHAKLADFGLSKAFAAENDSHISTRPAGTPGYLDPEFQSSGNLNRKSDVYSFGVILFELITGYPAVMRSSQGNNIHIVQWVRQILETGGVQRIVDPRLDGKFNVNSAWKLVEIAMSCVPATAIQRPDISHVLAELKECQATEMVSDKTNKMGSSKRRSTGSFEMMPLDLHGASAPVAR